MRVVGVSRVLDEADIIEPFIRHHAALLDLHILLDNGSTDGTVEILRDLQAEGVPLQVYQTTAPVFLEQAYNTGLYRLALGEGADWVFHLDADELLRVAGAKRPAEVLALVPDGIPALRLPVFRYSRPAPTPHPLLTLQHRAAEPEMFKVALPRHDPARITVAAGNHFAFLDGREEAGLPQDRLTLAHAPDRSALQSARKAIVGRLKPLASGAKEADFFSVHRRDTVAALKADPRAWLTQSDQVTPGPIADPVDYLGGPLRHTQPPDDLARLMNGFIASMETLARSHGAILDSKRLIKQQIIRRGQEIRRLF